MIHALIVVGDADARQHLKQALEARGYEVSATGGVEQGRVRLDEQPPDLFIVDLSFEGAWRLLRDARRTGVDAIVALGEDRRECEPGVGAPGGVAFLEDPFHTEGLRLALHRIGCTPGVGRNRRSRPQAIRKGRLGSLLGASDPMTDLFGLIQRVAPSRASVLISGESGSGKELVARTIHALGPRRNEPFLAVNCGAIPPTLMESEIFGHEKGSFSGASRLHRGLFERAESGTLFLDEVTEMKPELQVKLLRVLETGTFVRVGGETSVEVDVRIIAATNRCSLEAVRNEKLRKDLCYRLKVLHVKVPPLRDRLEDIPLLVPALLREIAQTEQTEKSLGPDVMKVLQAYHWPGNIRQLRNCLYTAFLLSEGQEIQAEALPAEVTGDSPSHPEDTEIHIPVTMSLKEAERRIILSTLSHLDGRRNRAAEVLGVSLKTLYNRLQDYDRTPASA